jgi:hypothetical protein
LDVPRRPSPVWGAKKRLNQSINGTSVAKRVREEFKPAATPAIHRNHFCLVLLLQVRAYREKMMAATGLATMFPLW